MGIPQAIEKGIVFGRLASERLRAVLLRLRGCRVGRGALVGKGTRVDRPWTVALGDRCQLEPGVWIKVVADSARVTIGDYTFLGRRVEIDASTSVSIGNHVLVAPGVFVTDHAHRIAAEARIGDQGCVAGPVVVEDDAWLGAQSVILPGVRIGRGAVVGAGAVVTHDVPPGAVVAGVPARVLRQRT